MQHQTSLSMRKQGTADIIPCEVVAFCMFSCCVVSTSLWPKGAPTNASNFLCCNCSAFFACCLCALSFACWAFKFAACVFPAFLQSHMLFRSTGQSFDACKQPLPCSARNMLCQNQMLTDQMLEFMYRATTPSISNTARGERCGSTLFIPALPNSGPVLHKCRFANYSGSCYPCARAFLYCLF
jgi:hypothetical protein